MEALEVSLVPGWAVPARGGDPPDDAVRAILARLRLRLGFDGLVPHLAPLPVVSTLLELCRALSALAGRVNQRVRVSLDGDVSLDLDLSAAQLRVSVRGRQGAHLLEACPIPARPLIRSLVTAGRAFIADLERAAPALAETALARSLQAAIDGLDGQLLPVADTGVPESPPASSRPTGGVRLAHDGHSTLSIRLGQLAVDIDDCPAPIAAEALVQLVRDAITTRDWPPGRQLVPIDAAGHRSFALLRSDLGLGLTVVDAAAEALGPAMLIAQTDLARAAWHGLSAMAADFDEHAEAVLRLLRWAQAIARPLGSAAGVPVGWSWPPRATPEAEAEALPVAGLHHLAWRRVWRHEAPGLLKVDEAADGLLIFDEAGLTDLARASGEPRWQRPGLRPISRAPSGMAVDGEGRVVALRGSDGNVRWRCALEADAPVVGVARSDGGLVLQTDATLVGLDHDGRRRWRYDTWYGHILGLAIHGPLCWAVAEDGFLHAIRVRDGARQFVRPISGEPEPGVWTCAQGVVVASTQEPGGRGCLAVYHPLDGHLIWRTACEGALAQAPELNADLIFVLSRVGDRCAVEARRLDDGALVWRHGRLSAGRLCQLHHVGDLLCLKSADGGVLALDMHTGQPRWRLAPDDTEESLASNTPPVSRRGILLVPGTTIRVVDPGTGRLIQTFDCGELMPDWLHVWPNGDLAIAEDDAVVRYALGGHLALVR